MMEKGGMALVEGEEVVAESFRRLAERNGKPTEDDWAALSVLFDKTLVKAVRLVDEGAVRKIVGEESGRFVWRVLGGGRGGGTRMRESYVCLGLHSCSCQNFLFDVVGKGAALRCKHQIAVGIAEALGRYSVIKIPDEDLATLLCTSA